MPIKAQTTLNGGAAESGGRAGDKGGPTQLADGVALMEAMAVMPDENQGGQRFESEAVVEGEDSETAVDEGAGASTEAVGADGELSSQDGADGAADGAEGTEGDEGSSTEGTESGDTESTEEDGAQAAVNERIGEITAKRKEAEEKLTVAQAERDEWKRKAEAYEADPGARPKGYLPPIERIDAVREAREAVSKAANTRELAEGYLAGEPEAALEAVRKAGVNMATPEAATAYLQQLARKAERAELMAEARREAVEFQAKQVIEGERRQLSAAARTVYPWINNAGSTERRVFDEVLKAYPFLKEDPAFEMALGDMVTGAMARQSKVRNDKGQSTNDKGNPNVKGAARPAAVKTAAAPGKPKVAAGAGRVGTGNNGGNGNSIRDRAMKDPSNPEARVRFMENYANVSQ